MQGGPAGAAQRVLIAALLTLAAACARPHGGATNEIDYRGVKIKLTKFYASFEQYKNDPRNVDPSETAHVQRLVMTAPIAREFRNRLEAAKAAGEIAFPGYGLGGLSEQSQPDGGVLTGFSIEIPRAEKDRYFIFHSRQGKYRLIDDFVAPNTPPILRVAQEGQTLVLSTMQGSRVLTRPLTGQE